MAFHGVMLSTLWFMDWCQCGKRTFKVVFHMAAEDTKLEAAAKIMDQRNPEAVLSFHVSNLLSYSRQAPFQNILLSAL